MTGWAAGWPHCAGWAAGPPVVASGRWVVTPVYGPAGIALATRVWLAVLPDTATPGEPDWLPGSWVVDGQAAADVASLEPGVYMTWLRVDWPPERPVIRAGRVRIGEGP